MDIPNNRNGSIHVPVLIPEKLGRHGNPDALFGSSVAQDNLFGFLNVLASQSPQERQLLRREQNHTIIQIKTEFLGPFFKLKKLFRFTQQGLRGPVHILDLTIPIYRDDRKWNSIKNLLRDY